jgi:hypothetical protein
VRHGLHSRNCSSAAGKIIEACEKDGLDAGKLKKEFWQGFSLSPREVMGCAHIVLGYVGVFCILFAFDWIADVYSSLAGGLTMLVPLLLPTLIGYGTLRWVRLGEQITVRQRDFSCTELVETSNPTLLPQTTNDDLVLMTVISKCVAEGFK